MQESLGALTGLPHYFFLWFFGCWLYVCGGGPCFRNRDHIGRSRSITTVKVGQPFSSPSRPTTNANVRFYFSSSEVPPLPSPFSSCTITFTPCFSLATTNLRIRSRHAARCASIPSSSTLNSLSEKPGGRKH